MSFQKLDHEDRNRPEGKTCILVYGYDALAYNKIKVYAKELSDLETIEVKPSQVHHTLGQLIEGEQVAPSQETMHPLSPTIVLNAVSNAELNEFVHNFKSLSLPRPLFAMVTPTSIKWPFKQLIADLLEERAMFEKMRAQQQQQ